MLRSIKQNEKKEFKKNASKHRSGILLKMPHFSIVNQVDGLN
jgi:hypothetical protein